VNTCPQSCTRPRLQRNHTHTQSINHVHLYVNRSTEMLTHTASLQRDACNECTRYNRNVVWKNYNVIILSASSPFNSKGRSADMHRLHVVWSAKFLHAFLQYSFSKYYQQKTRDKVETQSETKKYYSYISLNAILQPLIHTTQHA